MTDGQRIEGDLRRLCERNSAPVDESAFAERLRRKTSRVRTPAPAPRRRHGLRVAVYACAAVVVVVALTVGSVQLVEHLRASDDIIVITDPTVPTTPSGATPATQTTSASEAG